MKKKKLILILTIILIGIILLNGGFYLFKKLSKTEKMNQTVNITSMITLDNPEAKVYPNFYLLENEKGITLYNFENQELYMRKYIICCSVMASGRFPVHAPSYIAMPVGSLSRQIPGV